jgi:hypothetical protein
MEETEENKKEEKKIGNALTKEKVFVTKKILQEKYGNKNLEFIAKERLKRK